ncbi:hypothetical protein EIP86_006239 [Pleurotus ostreatoroseus]|nr:hypothetical protein EIP86_006239 [Pleurotus ostreatoroseus]
MLPDGSLQLYRVDKTFLSRYSSVFDDMLSMPAPQSIETIDDVPVVHLPDDAQDVSTLLETLYNPSKLIFESRNPDNAIIAAQLLRMSAKYEITYITTAVKQQVLADWPVTFEDFERAYATEEVLKHHLSRGRHQGKALDDVLPEPASAIRLALDFDIPSILPAAFSTLSSRDVSHDWDELRKPGTDPESWDVLGIEMVRTARWSMLTAPDLLRLMKGRAALVPIIKAAFHIFSLPDVTRCNDCTVVLQKVRALCCVLCDDDYFCPDAMEQVNGWYNIHVIPMV